MKFSSIGSDSENSKNKNLIEWLIVCDTVNDWILILRWQTLLIGTMGCVCVYE